MKTNYFQALAVFIAMASISAMSPKALGQDSTAATQSSSVATTPVDSTAAPAQTAPVAAPPLAYGVSQILALQQAKIDDNTIIAYIRNSGNSYGLNADQIIYLRQQGLSSAVLNAMLSQPAAGVISPSSTVPMPSGPAPAVYNSQQYSQQPPPNYNNGAVGPAVTGIDPTAAAAANSYYYQPPYYPYYYSSPYYGYPYGYYPGISVGIGWGGRYGGWGGGWHGGGGWGGGGWHGGGGGWHR